MFKKILVRIMTFALLVGVVPSSAYAADAITAQGIVTDGYSDELTTEEQALFTPTEDEPFEWGHAQSYHETESNNTLSTANSIKNDDTFHGTVSGNDVDYYKFKLNGRHTVGIAIFSDTFDVSGAIYNSDGKQIGNLEMAEIGGFYFYHGSSFTLPSNRNNEYYYISVKEDYGKFSNYYLTFDSTQLSSDPSPFLDVTRGAYYYDPVLWAYDNDIAAGTSHTNFSPNAQCTRGQVVTFLWRAYGCPEPKNNNNPFYDVKSSDYYYKAVLWAVEKGITAGTAPGKFSPNDKCTRAQVVSFLWRTAGKPDPNPICNPFYDVWSTHYFHDAVLWALKNDITAGVYTGKFAPDQPCTRGQVVSFLYRAQN